MGFPRCSPVPVAAGGVETIDALYTGRGPVCGITIRRGAGTTTFGVFAAAADSAEIALTAPAASPACGATAACSVTTAGAAGTSATGAAGAGGLRAIFSSRTGGAAGGFTTTAAGGGATTTRTGTAPAGGLAIMVPAGGREAIAGVEGGGATTIGGAGRGCGTILRGGAWIGAAATGLAATGAAAAGAAALAGTAVTGFAGTRTWRASSSSSFFLARSAFITSPGLEMCERSILGTMASAPWRPDVAPPCAEACFDSRAKCARTFSASSSSSELECVFPLETPSSGRTSRIARDFTSSSFARSLIRTLLIRLFSICTVEWPLSFSLLPHRTSFACYPLSSTRPSCGGHSSLMPCLLLRLHRSLPLLRLRRPREHFPPPIPPPCAPDLRSCSPERFLPRLLS